MFSERVETEVYQNTYNDGFLSDKHFNGDLGDHTDT